MKLSCLLFVCLCLVVCSSCNQHVVEGKGAIKNTLITLPATGFTKVDISAPVDAHITVGGAATLSFDGYSNLLPYLHTEVVNNTLRIYTDDNTNFQTDKHIIANITLPMLTGLELAGSGDAVVTGAVNTPAFAFDASGSGSLVMQELHVQSFKSEMSGSHHLELQHGDIGDGSFEVSGSGKIRAFDVSQQTTAISVSGSGMAEVNTAGKLAVSISGSGAVRYKGHPSITRDISGSGSVSDAN